VATRDVMSDVINLGDDSDNGVEVFVPGRMQDSRVLSVKRNLLAAFSGSDDLIPSTSKISKPSQD
ncbi:hypothetical protein A2U01_0055847, partial [Trifolium medium]|nr:hypothetical protein [Trifolium medium]